MQQNLELVLYNKNYYISFELLFILLLPEQSSFFGKNNSKRDLVETSGFIYIKIIFAIQNKILIVMWDLLLYIFGTLALRNFSWILLKFSNTRILDFKIILRIYYKLFLLYFDTKKIVGLSPWLERSVERSEDAKSPNSSRRAIKVSFKDFNRVTQI